MHVLLGKRKLTDQIFHKAKRSKPCLETSRCISKKRKHVDYGDVEFCGGNNEKIPKREASFVNEATPKQCSTADLKFFSVFKYLDLPNNSSETCSDHAALNVEHKTKLSSCSESQYSENNYWREILPSFDDVCSEDETRARGQSDCQHYNAFQYWNISNDHEDMELEM